MLSERMRKNFGDITIAPVSTVNMWADEVAALEARLEELEKLVEDETNLKLYAVQEWNAIENKYNQLRKAVGQGMADTLHDYEQRNAELREALNLFDAEGIKSWAEVIVREWHEGKKDHASMKVAEKILDGLRKLETP